MFIYKSENSADIKNFRENFAYIVEGYEPHNIYNADESNISYLACKSPESKESLTILLAANMDGSDKQKLLFIGKRFYINGKYNELSARPAIHKINSDGSMTSAIFREWLVELDQQMKYENRKIILFLDNVSSHSPNKMEPPFELSNIKLHYFPPNCTSEIQPMDNGIIDSVKREFEKIKNGKDKLSVNDAIEYLNKIWQETDKKIIEKAFLACE